jgi:hypothetical protein
VPIERPPGQAAGRTSTWALRLGRTEVEHRRRRVDDPGHQRRPFRLRRVAEDGTQELADALLVWQHAADVEGRTRTDADDADLDQLMDRTAEQPAGDEDEGDTSI